MLCETSLTLTTLISYQSWAGGTDKIKMNVPSITLNKYLKKICQKFCNAREKFLTNNYLYAAWNVFFGVFPDTT